MVVAYITADREALFSIISNPDKFTAAAPFTFLVGFPRSAYLRRRVVFARRSSGRPKEREAIAADGYGSPRIGCDRLKGVS